MCENAKILCPYCLTREIDPAQAICSACYSKEDKWERGSWDDLRKRKNADEIQMFTISCLAGVEDLHRMKRIWKMKTEFQSYQQTEV